MTFEFEVDATDGAARRGKLRCGHGEVETPAFMPVATLGAVKGLSPRELAAAGAPIMLSNVYHLALRPGVEVIVELGGLHAFTGWSGPILTDSGGFQLFSLARLTQVDAAGVTFRSHVDGSARRFTPAGVVHMQARLGVDIAMVLDECPPWPVSADEAAVSLERTNRWAQRSREAWPDGAGALFGIVQGSVYPRLRERAAREITALGFDGYAIGGVCVGEPLGVRRRVVEQTAVLLPPRHIRYLMGVGTPEDVLHAVQHGVDLFDCVLPSRNARHGLLFTRRGPLRIKNARFRSDPRPLDEECCCAACGSVSRAFLHHLVRCGEITGQVLATIHNIHFYLDFMADVREAIASATVGALASRVASWRSDGSLRSPAAVTDRSAASTPLGSPDTTLERYRP